MAVKQKVDLDLFEKLKKEIASFAKQETQGRQKINQAIKKARKLGKAYKAKLSRVVDDVQTKLSKVQNSSYSKLAKDIQQQLIKTIETKGNAIVEAIASIEKKQSKRAGAKKRTRKAKRKSTK